jgi:hypothetical protein
MPRKLTIGPTRRTQLLASGLTIRQDFCEAVRFVFFETGFAEATYATHGGTAFVVNYRGCCYGLTAQHVRQDFDWAQLVISDTKIGKRKAPIRAVFYPSTPREEAIGSDVMDVTLIQFIDQISPDFFQGSAYVVDSKTVASSKNGHSLLVAGALKEKSEILDNIAPGYCLLQFTDTGPVGSDPALRQAVGRYANRQFESITGLSGAPVYDEICNALCGMVLRGGSDGELWRVRFLDIFDIMQLLEAAHTGKPEIYYRKTLTRRTLTRVEDHPIVRPT